MMRNICFWMIGATCGLLLWAAPARTQDNPTTTPPPVTERSSTRGFDPVMATLASAFNGTTEATATRTPISDTRSYDPLFLTMQAWADRQTATEPAQTPTPISDTRSYDPLLLTMQAWADRQTATEPPCIWMWASTPLSAQNTTVQAALNTANAEAVVFEASLFGENCVDAASGDVRSFFARDILYRLTISGDDAATLGDVLTRALPIIQSAAQTQTQPVAEITLIFTDADLDPIRLTPQLLDRVLENNSEGTALIARMYAVSLR